MKKLLGALALTGMLLASLGATAYAQTWSGWSGFSSRPSSGQTSSYRTSWWTRPTSPKPTSTTPVTTAPTSTPVTKPTSTAPITTTPPATTTPATPATSTAFSWGAFTGNTTAVGSWQALFVADGDSFTADAQGFTKPLVVYWESNYTASQIANGSADSFLKNWAAQMVAYKQPVIFNVLDEMNGNWSAYYGNPSAFVSAYQHVHSLFASGTNVKFAYDPNVAFSGTPVSTFTSYYPGDAYVDIVGLDGFDFGGQTFSQVFQSSIQAMKADFPSKPLWILSMGAVNTDSQSAFMSATASAAKTYGIQGVIYFDYQQFVIPASTLSSTL